MKKRKAQKNKKVSKSAKLNQKAQWDTYRKFEMRAKKAWDKLRNDIRKKAPPQIILRDQNDLLLLLGECNYMTRECMRCSSSPRTRPRAH